MPCNYDLMNNPEMQLSLNEAGFKLTTATKRSFNKYNLSEYEKYLDKHNLKRSIKEIHIHHTYAPTKKQYVGESTIYGMWYYHTHTNGWKDIGQHITIAPDGVIWDGRSLEDDPASILGRNIGAIAIEIIGNFDLEIWENPQKEVTIKLVRMLLDKFNLNTNNIIFHREYAPKTCPGMKIQKGDFIKMVNNNNNNTHPKVNVKVNSETYKPIVDPVIIDGRTMIYAGDVCNIVDIFIKEAFNPFVCGLDWDNNTKTLSMFKKSQE